MSDEQVAPRRRRRLTLAVSPEVAVVEEELPASQPVADVAVGMVPSPPTVHRRHSAPAVQLQSVTSEVGGMGLPFFGAHRRRKL